MLDHNNGKTVIVYTLQCPAVVFSIVSLVVAIFAQHNIQHLQAPESAVAAVHLSCFLFCSISL